MASSKANVRKHWRFFLLGFSAEEFACFVESCKGSYDAGVMAEAVSVVVARRQNPDGNK